jgi:hypothetical protein
LRCLVCGSFQPFLEALRGHEVVGLNSTSALAGTATSAAGTPPPQAAAAVLPGDKRSER